MTKKMKGRRMISREIYESHIFLTQVSDADCKLYTYLCLNTDDDGVVEALRVMRIIQATAASLKHLIHLGLVKLLDDQDTVYITDFHRINTLDRRWTTPSKHRDLLVKIVPEVKEDLYGYCENESSRAAHENLSSCSRDPRATTKTTKKTKTKDINNNVTKIVDDAVEVVDKNDIKAYICTHNYIHVDGDKFCAYYMERGWICNGEPIRDWRSLVDLWEQNPKSTPHQHDYDFARLESEIVANNP